MFAGFIQGLRSAGVPVSITEHLSLMGAMQAGAADYSVEDFYFLARSALVKDERWFDRFDRVFAQYFKGLETVSDDLAREIPEDWLRKLAEKTLTADEMAAVEALGGFDKLMETLRQRLAPKAFVSARTARATAARSRCGTGASSAISTTGSS
jgi:uncharacterized protein with von Willebrand factor type A (vWA) domain